MPREDRAKLAEWRERLTRFDRSEETVGEFCSVERVSVATFYYWKKKLSKREHAFSSLRSTIKNSPNRVSANAGGGSLAASDNGIGKNEWNEFEQERLPRSNGRAFQPVEITPGLSLKTTTIRIPGGVAIELGDDLRVVESVVALLLDRCRLSGTAAC